MIADDGELLADLRADELDSLGLSRIVVQKPPILDF
jgi:hypothetical protein